MNVIGNLFAAFSFIALTILIPPLMYHSRNGNIPAISLFFWFIITNLFAFINAIIWSGDEFYQGYDGRGLCDIEIKLNIGSVTGKLCSITALTIQLFMILRADNVKFMNNKSRFKIWFDLAVCLICPIIVMPLSYIVQSGRIGIVRYGGCVGVYDYNWVYLMIQSIPNFLWSFVAIIFAAMTLITFYQRKKDVKDILKCTNSGLDMRRFSRLLIFSLIVILTLMPLALYNLIYDSQKFNGAFNFAAIHEPIAWNQTYFAEVHVTQLYYRWIDVGLSIIAFLIFGLGSDAVKMYTTILIGLKFDRVFNIKHPDLVEEKLATSRITSKTATNQTQKTQFSAGTGVSSSTFTVGDGLDIEFNKLMEDDDESPTMEKSINVHTIVGGDSPSDTETEAMNYVMNGDEESDITYHFNITRN